MRKHMVAVVLLAWGIAATLPSQTFDKTRLSANYYAEGANAGDFNRDGVMDVVAGPFWWAGPDFAVPQAIYPPQVFPQNGYADNFLAYALDVNGDGWEDVLTIGFPGTAAHWYANPGTPGPLWTRHVVHASVGHESPTLTELVGGGAPELVCASGGRLGYLTKGATPTAPWTFHAISPPGAWPVFSHGLGVGDVNGDGRLDVITNRGWFEQPPSVVNDPLWTEHPFSFATVGGAQMFATDVDGDQDADVITSINAHGYGLSWFEHMRVNNSIRFAEHEIFPKTRAPAPPLQTSQLHAVALADLDGDGRSDIVTGKTYWAHNGADPGANDPALVLWFRQSGSGAMTTFVPSVVDSDSGLGRQVVVKDVNRDGKLDIVAANKKGVFVFRQETVQVARGTVRLSGPAPLPVSLDFGRANAGKQYTVFGSITGQAPGVVVGGVHVRLNPDAYTQFASALINTPMFAGFQGALDANGRATATLRVPRGLTALAGSRLHHAAIVFAGAAFQTASNTESVLLVP